MRGKEKNIKLVLEANKQLRNESEERKKQTSEELEEEKEVGTEVVTSVWAWQIKGS